jgi:hypothetical protein
MNWRPWSGTTCTFQRVILSVKQSATNFRKCVLAWLNILNPQWIRRADAKVSIKNSTDSNSEEPRSVKATCTDEGWFFETGQKRIGPFSHQEIDRSDFDLRAAAELGVESKQFLAAKLRDYRREITIAELNSILSLTIKRDEPTKAITFLGMLLSQTMEDQFNIGFQAESSTGKSYIPLEIAAYFPSEDIRIYAGASPTSFFHQVGKWGNLTDLALEIDLAGLFDSDELSNDKRKVIFVDLEGKILIFMDQPHWMLMEKLRPLLSHDKKILRYDITDKTGKGGLRTKTVIIRGYPVVVFASAKPTQEDQERTRMWLLSPGTDEEKLIESLKLLGIKIANREAFAEWVKSQPMRTWLRESVQQIRNSRSTASSFRIGRRFSSVSERASNVYLQGRRETFLDYST